MEALKLEYIRQATPWLYELTRFHCSELNLKWRIPQQLSWSMVKWKDHPLHFTNSFGHIPNMRVDSFCLHSCAQAMYALGYAYVKQTYVLLLSLLLGKSEQHNTFLNAILICSLPTYKSLINKALKTEKTYTYPDRKIGLPLIHLQEREELARVWIRIHVPRRYRCVLTSTRRSTYTTQTNAKLVFRRFRRNSQLMQ